MPDHPLTPLALALVPVVGHAVASPAAPLVAAVVEEDARAHLALYPLDGGPGRRLTADVAPSGARLWGPRDIDWSPDGKRIAFERDGGGVFRDIFRMKADGTNSFNLTDSGILEANPNWQPR